MSKPVHTISSGMYTAPAKKQPKFTVRDGASSRELFLCPKYPERIFLFFPSSLFSLIIKLRKIKGGTKMTVTMTQHIEDMMHSYEQRRDGIRETCGKTRKKYLTQVIEKQREWLSPFYQHGSIDPNGYFEDADFLYTVLKRYCYEEFGANALTYEEFMKNEAFSDLFPITRLPITPENEYIVFSLYLLVEESKAINEVYESSSPDKKSTIAKIKHVIGEWKEMKNNVWYERDGFGFYRLSFFTDDEHRFQVVVNWEDEGRVLTFDLPRYTEEIMLGHLDEFERYQTQLVNRTTDELLAYFEEEKSITLPDLIGRNIRTLWKVKNDEFFLTCRAHNQVLTQLRGEKGTLYRLDGRQVYNTETIVREICEDIREMVRDAKRDWAEKEQAEQRALQLFQSTLSERDVVGHDYMILTGKDYDYVMLLKGNKVIDFVRVKKGEELTEEAITSLCIHPKDTWIPRYDGFATFSLLIKSGNEKMINDIANPHRIKGESLRRVQELYA